MDMMIVRLLFPVIILLVGDNLQLEQIDWRMLALDLYAEAG